MNELICTMYKEGKSLTQIGKELGIDRKKASKIVKENGIEVKKNPNEITLDAEGVRALYLNGASCTKIASEIGVSLGTVVKELKRQGVEVIAQPNKFSLDEDEVLRLYATGMSLTNIAKSLEVSRGVITRVVKNKGCVIGLINNKTHTHHCDFFKTIDTEEKAYWLGFIYADGCVSSREFGNGKYCLEIGLARVDIDHLSKFKESVNTTSPIITRTSTLNGKGYESCRITIHDKEFVNHLIHLGCTPRKSLTLTFPTEEQVPEHLVRHFIRGYFDGDGSVYWDSGRKLSGVSFNLLGTEKFLKGVLRVFESEVYGFTPVSIYSKGDSKVKFILKSGKQAISILNYLYKDANILLDRKFNKFTKFKQKYDNCRPR